MPRIVKCTNHEFPKEIVADGQQNSSKIKWEDSSRIQEINELSHSNVFEGLFQILKRLSILF